MGKGQAHPAQLNFRDCFAAAFADQQRQPLASVGQDLAALTYSHSIVPGGLLVMSYTTRFTPLTSLTMRVDICSKRS